MDSAARVMCQDNPINPLIISCYQVSWILVVSHIFHLVLKPLGQPGPVAQILAGLVLGPSVLCRIDIVKAFFNQSSSADYYRVYAFFSRIFFMFLIGLELDIPYLKRNLRGASTIAYGGLITSGITGAAMSWFVIQKLGITFNKAAFGLLIMVHLANTASPAVIRLAAELKFDTSEIGRLVVSSSLITEMSCVLLFSLFIACTDITAFKFSLLSMFLTGVLIIVNKYLAFWFNRRNRGRKYAGNSQVLLILVLIILLSMVIEYNGLYSTIPCFLVGAMFPREGKMARTLLHKLTYAVYDFILPIYFGYTGFQLDVDIILKSLNNVIIVLLMLLVSIASKILGTLAACSYLKIPLTEGVILGFMLNLKGHVELMLTDSAPDSETWWGQDIHTLLIAIIVVNTVVAGPVVSFILIRKETHFAHNHTTVEFLDPESELQMVSCVYAPRNASGQLGLFSALHGSEAAPITPYLMHLVELPKERKKKKLMYHQLQDGDQFSDEEEYGGNDVIEINDAVDNFIAEAKIFVHQNKVVQSFPNMYDEVCTRAEDLRVSLIFLPFHKHQRIDGKMENGRDEMRTTNQKVLRHAPCSVGILVDRGCLAFQKLLAPNCVQNVATLFFGGPDDREALACSKRIAMHAHLNLTVIRFLQVAPSGQNLASESTLKEEEIFLAISRRYREDEKDDAFVEDFYNKYVSTGQIGYVEKSVSDGAGTMTALRDIGEMYSLFVVGKGGRGFSPMTTGMSDWEECPELGTVGDLLASMDFDIRSSVLVIQQHRHLTKGGFNNNDD